MQTALPEPGADACAHSDHLTGVIRERVTAAGGWISFSDYMRAALYEPGLGYYSAGAAKFGVDGDFVTAPEISPLFSRTLAGQCAEILAATDGDTVLELGGGTGRMALDMLLEFDRLGRVPERYLLLETSAELRQRQAGTLSALPKHLRDRVTWLDCLPESPVTGVIVGNEVADALPVQRFVIDDGRVLELGVSVLGQQLVAETRVADKPLEDFVGGLGLMQENGYCSEVNFAMPGWIAALSDALATGMVLLLDYGYSRSQYYLPDRNRGTLRCYYRHRVHADPFFLPGLQDITAWVDFTAVAEAADAADLQVAAYTTQAHFLLSAGIDALIAAASAIDNPQTEVARMTQAAQLRKLMMPGEMGEAIKVMGLTRGMKDLPTGFSGRDMRSVL